MRKVLEKTMKNDIKQRNLMFEDAQDREMEALLGQS